MRAVSEPEKKAESSRSGTSKPIRLANGTSSPKEGHLRKN